MSFAYQLNNIEFFYGKTRALFLPQLNIEANKVTALIGPNGCGKSTLLNLLSFFTENQLGHINFFTEKVSHQQIPLLIKRVAFLPQKPYMLRGTVASNLNLVLKFHHIKKYDRPAKIHAALEKLNVAHLSEQQATKLSGGELQKVALARAMITNPEVLLMDEPFSYLDYNSEHKLEQFISNYVNESGKTLLFSTHNRLQGMAIADNVISLLNGQWVKTPLINLFHGSTQDQLFNSGKIQIMLADHQHDYQHVSIDPHEIVISRTPLVSSMRNQYQGKVMAITDQLNNIRVSILAGELFQVLITDQAFKDLNISLGEQLWVNFKSNSIQAF